MHTCARTKTIYILNGVDTTTEHAYFGLFLMTLHIQVGRYENHLRFNISCLPFQTRLKRMRLKSIRLKRTRP